MAFEIFITPKPSETIFSILSRAHIMSAAASPLVTLKRLTDHRGYKPLSSLPSNLTLICERVHLKDSPEVVIRRHTLFNLYKPFLPASRRDFVLQGMLASGAVKSRLGLLKSHCGAADQLAHCSECAKNDIFTIGYAYWRREHMLVGVEVCHIHKVFLTKTCLNYEKYETRCLQLPSLEKSPSDWNSVQYEKLLFISEQVALITNIEADVFIDSSSYLTLLKSHNVVTPSSHLRMRVLQHRVRDWLKPIAAIQPFDELFSALDVERNWVANLVAGKEGMHHPLKHIILWGTLDLDYRAVIEMLQVSKQFTLPLTSPVKSEITKEILADAVEKYHSARGAARFLNCSVNTVLVLMEKFGFPIKRRSKKLDESVVNRVLELTSKGLSTSVIARELNLSIPTINRIKRGSS